VFWRKLSPNIKTTDEKATMSRQHFVYDHLPDNHIRVLRPVLSQPEQSLEWSLEILKLDPDNDEEAAYEALSYAWGEQTTTHPIVVNDHDFLVHDNLFEALPCLARRRQGNIIPIWIDVISINQKDDVEKLAQIRMMADIFRRASNVWVWLGYVPLESSAAVSEAESKIFSNLKALEDKLRESGWRGTFTSEECGLPPLDSPAWDIHKQVFHAPWFDRL
jgi:hypothetical protein